MARDALGCGRQLGLLISWEVLLLEVVCVLLRQVQRMGLLNFESSVQEPCGERLVEKLLQPSEPLSGQPHAFPF